MKFLHTPLKTSSTSSDDQAIIQKVLNGDHNAFEQLMRKYNQRLFRIGVSILKEETEVPDVMQNCYLKAFEKLEQFKGNASFSTWLTRIMINESLARIKEKNKTNKLQLQDFDDEDHPGDGIANLPDHKPNPEASCIHNETSQMAESAILSLPDKYRIVYIMKMVEGMDTNAISKALNISKTNVKIRNFRAKNMIREKMQQLSGDSEPFQFLNGRCDQVVNNVLPHITSTF